MIILILMIILLLLIFSNKITEDTQNTNDDNFVKIPREAIGNMASILNKEQQLNVNNLTV